MPRPDSVMTFNVFEGRNLPQIVKWVSRLPYLQVVTAFQEVPDPEKSGFGEELKRLGYDYRFARGFKRGDLSYGQVTAVRSDLPIVDSRVVRFGGNLKENIALF